MATRSIRNPASAGAPAAPNPRRRWALIGMAVVVMLLGACTEDKTESAVETRRGATSAGQPTPSPQPTPPKLKRKLARLERAQERAAGDGRIDRREAIRLARGVSTKTYKYIEAKRVWRKGDGEFVSEGDRRRLVWDVLLMERGGCHQRSTIDVRTGESGKYTILGCP